MYEINDPLTPEYLPDPYRQVVPADEDPGGEDHSDDEPTIYGGDSWVVTDEYLLHQTERIAKQRTVAALCREKGLELCRVCVHLNSGAWTAVDLFICLRRIGPGTARLEICQTSYVTTGYGWTKVHPMERFTGLTLEEIEAELKQYDPRSAAHATMPIMAT